VWFTVLGAATIAAIVAVGALPARNWLDLRRTSDIVERRLAELDAANLEAEAEAAALQSDAEVERIAREQYGYARAGEEVYHLLPEARDPVRVPDTWPFTGLGSAIAP
jgi:cell division protein FtsB